MLFPDYITNLEQGAIMLCVFVIIFGASALQDRLYARIDKEDIR